jgi:flagellar protein FliS
MAYSNALTAYKQTRIKTAGQGQLIIMLYDGAVKSLDSALELIKLNLRDRDPARIEKISKALQKAEEIVTELMVSLDFETGGEIARNLFSIYAWFNKELLQASINSDVKRISSVRTMIDELRGAWVDIVSRAAMDDRRSPAGISLAG